jgi:hypothetical protein
VTALLAASVATGQARDGGIATSPVAHAAATCSEYPNQKAAQEAADTRDADGDGSTALSTRGSNALGV